MNGDSVFDIAPVTAAHYDDHRHSEPRASAEDHVITLRERLRGHTQAPQLVVFVRIRPGDVERDVETIGRKGGGQTFCNRSEVFAIAAAIGQRDVERAALFSKREVVRPMHRKREHVGFVTKNRCRAVPLMHVRIENDGSPDLLFVHQPTDGDRDVVKNAITFAVIGVSMVGAAGEVDRIAVVQRGAGRAHRGADGPTRTFDHLQRPGESDAPLFLRIQGSIGNAPHVRRVVRQGELRIRRSRWLDQFMWRNDPGGQHTLAQPAVLRHREAVPGRQRQYKMISVENLHARDRLR